MKEDDWRIWDKDQNYGDVLYKRAIGESQEMESAKSLCSILNEIYISPMRLLDVGCGAGHYLYSFKKRIDAAIDYTGLDATEHYIQLARQAFPKEAEKFYVGDIFQIPFEDNTFDLVTCNNVIFHLPPYSIRAIAELVRVSKQYLIVRTIFGARNYIIQEVRNIDATAEKDLIDPEGIPKEYNYLNMYTEQYYREIITEIDPQLHICIKPDTEFGNLDLREETMNPTATRTLNGVQISGNLLLDWKFIIIEKRGKI